MGNMLDTDFIRSGPLPGSLVYEIARLEQRARELGAHDILAQIDQDKAKMRDMRDQIAFGSD